jgi:hypothetical protein
MRKFALAISLALGFLVFPVSAAATEPTISHSTVAANFTVSGVCAFGFTIKSTLEETEIDYFDASGTLTRIYFHVTEQDTYIGPRATFTSVPYTFNVELRFDSSGTLTGYVIDGVVLRIPLPNGSLFVAAGRINGLLHPGTLFFFSPDFGRSGNLDALCSALAGS